MFWHTLVSADGHAGSEGRETISLRLHGHQLSGLNTFLMTPRISSHENDNLQSCTPTAISTHPRNVHFIFLPFLLPPCDCHGGKLWKRFHTFVTRSVARLPCYINSSSPVRELRDYYHYCFFFSTMKIIFLFLNFLVFNTSLYRRMHEKSH